MPITAAWTQAACRCLARAMVAAVVITGLSVAALAVSPVGAAFGEASTGTGTAAASRQSTNATSTSSATGGLTMWCTTSNGYVNPGLLDLLATQYQSGPVETVTCVPAAVGPDGSITVLSVCTVSTTHTDPGLLDLLAAESRSGPVHTMTCVPASAEARASRCCPLAR